MILYYFNFVNLITRCTLHIRSFNRINIFLSRFYVASHLVEIFSTIIRCTQNTNQMKVFVFFWDVVNSYIWNITQYTPLSSGVICYTAWSRIVCYTGWSRIFCYTGWSRIFCYTGWSGI